MRWVRTNRGCGCWLALAAMALQLVLSFGHVHLDKLASASGTVATARAPSSPLSPVKHPANDTADDYCAICAAIHLVSTSFLPERPTLPLPFAFLIIEHFTEVAFVFVAPQRPSFQSRAPPFS
jgi:hypothetical protein